MPTGADRSTIGRRNKSRGKAVELAWAKALGTVRQAAKHGGESGAHEADIILPPYYIEVKSLKGMKRLIQLLAEAESETPVGGVPVLGLTLRDAPPGHRDWAVIPRSWFAEIAAPAPPD